MWKKGDATAPGLNFVSWRFAVRARPVGENVSFDSLTRACLESKCLGLRTGFTVPEHVVHDYTLERIHLNVSGSMSVFAAENGKVL